MHSFSYHGQVSQLDSFWNRGTRELGNGLLYWAWVTCDLIAEFQIWLTLQQKKNLKKAMDKMQQSLQSRYLRLTTAILGRIKWNN